MDFFDAVDSRSSAARLAEPVPDAADLDRILRAAVRAPDHGHLAPWRFIVMDAVGVAKFADVVAAALRSRDAKATDEELAAVRAKVRRAPMIILVVCVPDLDHRKIPEIEQVLAVGAAVQNLLLAAHALGYGAVWKTGPAAYDDHVKAALGLRSVDHIIAVVHIGSPQVMGPVRPPKLEGIVRDFAAAQVEPPLS